ncbi:bestrophin family protein [Silvimonas soli]|uniref:bestrophin family protein n=1 Tax=Silvimonas soli TaxID=2980100 RepID=UPI0024B3C728|nr:bestrophin family ion channel [Silvimonas soli]
MIIRPHAHWLRLLFVWRGSVLSRLLERLTLVCAVSVLAVLARGWWTAEFANSSLSIPPFTLMGIALAIFLGFRNSVSYERYWEARKLWGGLLVTARSITRQVSSSAPHSATGTALSKGMVACAYALQGQLRGNDTWADVQRLLPPECWPALQQASFKSAFILQWLGEQAGQMRRAGELTDWQWQAVDHNFNTVSEIIGGCERIAGTPIPFSYRVLLNRTITLYCMLLPIGLATSIGWLTPLISTFVAYTYLALDVIGEELEEPFGTEPNDLPLAALCHTIEAATFEVLGEPLAVTAPLPDNYILR